MSKSAREQRNDERAEEAQHLTQEQVAEKVQATGKAPRLGDFLYLVGEEVSLKRIAQIVGNQIRDGSPNIQRAFAKDFLDLLKAHEKITGDITEDEVARMADEQIYAILEQQFELAHVPPQEPQEHDGPGGSGDENPAGRVEGEGGPVLGEVPGEGPVGTEPEAVP